jgi:Na(+)-translocating NADH:ubiquinone oxidoreductase C subunit
MKNKRWFPIFYMFVVTACFSTVIIGFAQMTEEQVKANQARSFEVAVLRVLLGLYDPKAGAVELHQRFAEQVRQPTEETAGAYTLEQNGQIVAYALPFSGQGFWATIDGVIGIEPDKKTITNIVIYQQRETPGLGAEVAQRKFCDQFINLTMTAGDKPIVFRRPDEPLNSGEVHAVTGATQTSIRLEKIINDALRNWREQINVKQK